MPLNRFNPNESIEKLRPYVEDDGMLHVFASDLYRYDLEEYLFGDMEFYDQGVYRRVEMEINEEKYYALVSRYVNMARY